MTVKNNSFTMLMLCFDDDGKCVSFVIIKSSNADNRPDP
jgi:hypothetical protein